MSLNALPLGASYKNVLLHREAKSLQRVIVDFTDLIGHLARDGGVSGIPRVMFEFTNAAFEIAHNHGIDLLIGFFDQALAGYFQIDRPLAAYPHGRTLEWLLSDPMFRRGYPRPIDISKLRSKYAGRPIRRRWHVAYARCRLAHRRITGRLFHTLQSRSEFRELQFRQGDILLMLGSGWAAAPSIDYIEHLQKAGIVTSVALVHDLIPFLNLQHDDSVPAAVFEPWLDRVGRMACRLLAVSEATKSDLQNYFAKKQINVPPICVTPLPHEFSAMRTETTAVEIRSILSSNYALFVGPVSGRKNAKRLLEAWAKVLSRVGPGQTPTLVISSRRGAEEIYETHIKPIESHVRLLDRPGDQELSQLYAHAAFTAFPSLYEGWGLPVGESLWHGTPCITSNCSSMPEVGGPLCDYVDPTSVDSIADAVERFARDKEYRARRAAAIQKINLRKWIDFAQNVVDITLSAPAKRGTPTASKKCKQRLISCQSMRERM